MTLVVERLHKVSLVTGVSSTGRSAQSAVMYDAYDDIAAPELKHDDVVL
jgi:hypothetical protein